LPPTRLREHLLQLLCKQIRKRKLTTDQDLVADVGMYSLPLMSQISPEQMHLPRTTKTFNGQDSAPV
jgi:hypothetical protein